MDRCVSVILLLTGSCVLSSSLPFNYYYITDNKTWDDAETYCLDQYHDIAHVEHKDNITALKNAAPPEFSGKAWIGLFKDTTDIDTVWTWADGQLPTFFHWETDQPDTSEDSCVAMGPEGTWFDEPCNMLYPSFCVGNVESPPSLPHKIVVRMTMQSSANIADEVTMTNLKRQLQAALNTKKGVRGVTLTWTKKPVKQTQVEVQEEMKETCGPSERDFQKSAAQH